MANDRKDIQTIAPASHENRQPAHNMLSQVRELMKEPIVQELVIPAIKKEYLGIGKHDAAIIKGAGGRALYGLRDLIQGTWWAMMGFFVGTAMGLTIVYILYKFLRKVLGV